MCPLPRGVLSQQDLAWTDHPARTVAHLDLHRGIQVDDELPARRRVEVEVVVSRSLAKDHSRGLDPLRHASDRRVMQLVLNLLEVGLAVFPRIQPSYLQRLTSDLPTAGLRKARPPSWPTRNLPRMLKVACLLSGKGPVRDSVTVGSNSSKPPLLRIPVFPSATHSKPVPRLRPPHTLLSQKGRRRQQPFQDESQFAPSEINITGATRSSRSGLVTRPSHGRFWQ